MKLTKLSCIFFAFSLFLGINTVEAQCCQYNTEVDCIPQELYCGGLWLGINYASYSGEDWALMAGWYTECFLVDLGYNFESTKVDITGNTFNLHELRGDLGLRYRVCCSNLFLTGGAAFSYGFRSVHTPTRKDPYEIGAFVGLDYQLSRHFLISGKLAPYMYEKSFNRNTNSRVFAEGSFTLAYVF